MTAIKGETVSAKLRELVDAYIETSKGAEHKDCCGVDGALADFENAAPNLTAPTLARLVLTLEATLWDLDESVLGIQDRTRPALAAVEELPL